MEMTPAEQKRIKAQNLRYKKPALNSLSLEAIFSELNEISENCEKIRCITNSEGYDTILNSMDGDEEEAFEFRMMFSDVSAKVDDLFEIIVSINPDDFDDCSVALIGKKQKLVGYDTSDDDYYYLGEEESELAVTEVGKRMCRKTKADMLSTIGKCVGAMISFLDLRQQYDYLQATLEILLGENTAILSNMQRIDELYTDAERSGFHKDNVATVELDKIINEMPDRFWVE